MSEVAKQIEFNEIMRRLRRIETRQYRHAQLQGLDITDNGDKVRVRYDPTFHNVFVDSLDVSLSLIAKSLREADVKGEVKVYFRTQYIGSIHAAAVCDSTASPVPSVTIGDTPQ